MIEDPTSHDEAFLAPLLHQYNLRGPTRFKKIVSGRKLWNFDRKELEVWKAAL